jgi:hypothetical protein
MKSSITHISETVVINKPHLTITFTEEEVEALMLLGHTSTNSRTKLLEINFTNGITKPTHNIDFCAELLGDLYFYCADFKKEVYK